MSDLSTRIDFARFDRAVLRYVEDLGLDFPQAVQRSARLLNAELLRFTPPKTYAQGRAAVRRDINRAMMLLNPDKVHNRVLAQAIRDEEYEVVQAFIANLRRYRPSSLLARNKLRRFDPALHQSKRDGRGRVKRAQGIMVLERSKYERYVKEIQKHVGATKFGWAISGRRLGVSIPSWVLGHSERQGEYQENLNPKNPMIAMTNRAPGVNSIGAGFIQRMINRRTDAMNRDVQQILAGRASRFN